MFDRSLVILQIDVGNTRLHWRVIEAAGIGRWPRAQGHSLDRGAVPSKVLEWQIGRVELACVAAGEVRDSLLASVSTEVGVPVFEAATLSYACGLTNSYSEPSSMGVDRWLGMIGAQHHYPGGVVVVDAGTAVTVDYVSPDGNHLGGYILPGLELMRRALGTNTARVAPIGGDAPGAGPGQSTEACVEHGLGWLWSCAARKLCHDRAYYGLRHLVITGGDASVIASLVACPVSCEQDLVFLGMDQIFSPSGPYNI